MRSLLLIALLLVSGPAWAKRVALVAGAGAYTQLPALSNPNNDAERMAEVLAAAGYEVIAAPADATVAEMRGALARFFADIDGAEAAVFYFSGHGAQNRRGDQTYIFPADAEIDMSMGLDIALLQSGGFEVSAILAQMQARAEVSVMFLDSCRETAPESDPTKSVFGSASGQAKGISFVSVAATQAQTARGSFVGFATRAGDLASEGPAGGLSFYTAALIDEIAADTAQNRRRDIATLHRAVRGRVYAATFQSQRPDALDDLSGPFRLAAVVATPEPVAVTPQPQPSHDPCMRADTDWAYVVEDGETCGALRDYVAAHEGAATCYRVRRAARLRDRACAQAAISAPPSQPTSEAAEAQVKEAWREVYAAAIPGGQAAGVYPLADPTPLRNVVRDGDVILIHRSIGLRPEDLSHGDVFQECAECPEMVVIDGGSFVMGSPDDEPGRENDEARRRVQLGRFALARYETTFAEWDACAAAGVCRKIRRGGQLNDGDQGWGRERRPVITISWNDVQTYEQWLNSQIPNASPYGLPSEAQWEYAARAGSDTPFEPTVARVHGGRSITPSEANFDGDYTYNGSSQGQHRQQTVPVGSFRANAFGLYDMHGNVREWVEDCSGPYSEAPSDGSPRSPPSQQAEGCAFHIARGGSWRVYPQYMRSASRTAGDPNLRIWSFGFRPSRTLLE